MSSCGLFSLQERESIIWLLLQKRMPPEELDEKDLILPCSNYVWGYFTYKHTNKYVNHKCLNTLAYGSIIQIYLILQEVQYLIQL